MNTSYSDNEKQAILYFIKYPKQGQVKSRLEKDLDQYFIKQLYRNFVIDILNMIKKTQIPIVICYEPPEEKIQFQQWIGKNHVYLPQDGINLGERLNTAFKEGFRLGFNHLLVIGSDSPDLDQNIILTAFQKLTFYDVVIGPSSDGGYYLLAMTKKSYSPNYFKDINWSTKSVFSDTLKKINNEQQSVFILPEWYDIDTYEDLQAFYQRNLSTRFSTLMTMHQLKRYFDKNIV